MSLDDTLLGSARVRIRPDMTGFDRDTERGVSTAMKGAAKAAAIADKAFPVR